MQEHINVNKCERRGCVNNLHTKCTLDKLLISRFAEHLQYFQDSNTCIVRQQVNIFRTEHLIEDK